MRVTSVIDTVVHANTIINNLRTELIGKDIFDEISFVRSTNEFGLPEIFGEWRFNSRIDRDAVVDWIKGQVRDNSVVKTWVQSVEIITHLCTHDDLEVKDCSTTEYIRWLRG